LSQEALAPALKQYSDAINLLGGLIQGLQQKQKDGTWDRSLSVREEQAPYLTQRPDDDILAPWHIVEEEGR
jgi:hypothetical protein